MLTDDRSAMGHRERRLSSGQGVPIEGRRGVRAADYRGKPDHLQLIDQAAAQEGPIDTAAAFTDDARGAEDVHHLPEGEPQVDSVVAGQ
jgi:hypothetical protein